MTETLYPHEWVWKHRWLICAGVVAAVIYTTALTISVAIIKSAVLPPLDAPNVAASNAHGLTPFIIVMLLVGVFSTYHLAGLTDR